MDHVKLCLLCMFFLCITCVAGCKHIESNLTLTKEFKGGERVAVTIKISE